MIDYAVAARVAGSTGAGGRAGPSRGGVIPSGSGGGPGLGGFFIPPTRSSLGGGGSASGWFGVSGVSSSSSAGDRSSAGFIDAGSFADAQLAGDGDGAAIGDAGGSTDAGSFADAQLAGAGDGGNIGSTAPSPDGGSFASAQLGGMGDGSNIGPSVWNNATPSAVDYMNLGGAGPQGPLGLVYNPGGVLFDRCAEVLGDIGEITGAYWDTAEGCLVLLGKGGDGGDSVPYRLPKMDADNFAVALRAAIAGDSVGVSIDPPAEYRRGEREIQDGDDLLVSYLGGAEGTLFGAIMFEADRQMKCLSKGVDNESDPREEFRAHVPGYQPIIEMIKPGSSDGPTWHRFWFVIDSVEMMKDPASESFVFKDVRIKVLSEIELGGPVCSTIDPNDRAFTEHLTNHYDEYAKEFPVLARLRELAKLAALAKYLVQLGVPMDLEALFCTPSVHVDTAKTTKAIRVTSPNTEVTYTGSGTITRYAALCGGVDLDPPPPTILQDTSGAAKKIATIAKAARPAPDAKVWHVPSGSGGSVAKALPMGHPMAVRRFFDDAPNGGPGIPIRRVYNAARPAGDFGPGWSLFVPYSLTVWHRGGKRAEVITNAATEGASVRPPTLILHDHASGESAIYLSVEEDSSRMPVKFCRVLEIEDMEPDAAHSSRGRSIRYNAAEAILRTATGYRLQKNGSEFEFDESGRVSTLSERSGGPKTRFLYDAIGLAAVESDTGHRVGIERDRRRRIRKIVEGEKAYEFNYNRRNRLAAVKVDGVDRERYTYDSGGRLFESKDRSGRVLCRTIHDDFGRPIRSNESVITRKGAGALRREINDEAISCVSDESGTQASFKYWENGNLLMVTIREPKGEEWFLTYDASGHLASIRGSLGHVPIEMRHDPGTGLLNEVRMRERSSTFERGDQGQVIAIIQDEKRIPVEVARLPSQKNGPVRVHRADANLLEKAVAALSRIGESATAIEFTPGSGIASVKTPAGTAAYSHDRNPSTLNISFSSA